MQAACRPDEMIAANTLSVWPVRMATHFAAATSQTRTVRSPLAEASRRPSPLNDNGVNDARMSLQRGDSLASSRVPDINLRGVFTRTREQPSVGTVGQRLFVVGPAGIRKEWTAGAGRGFDDCGGAVGVRGRDLGSVGANRDCLSHDTAGALELGPQPGGRNVPDAQRLGRDSMPETNHELSGLMASARIFPG